MANITVAVLGVMVFTTLYIILSRQHLIYALSLFFIGTFLWLSYALRDSGMFSIWGFYLVGDLEAAIM